MKKADLIILSPVIFTGFQDETVSGMIAVVNGIIEYVGSNHKFEYYKGDNTQVIHEEKGMVVPGFHDSHIHLYLSALYESGKFNVCKGDQSEEECVKSLYKKALPVDNNTWILAAGWYHPIWNPRQLPSHKQLDLFFPDHPVCFLSEDCHSLWLNTKAKERLKINYDGEVIHDLDALLLLKEIMIQAQIDEEECIKAYIHKLNQYGITSVCDMAIIPDDKEDFVKDQCYESLLEKNELNIRIQMYPALSDSLDRARMMEKKYKSGLLTFGGVKQFYDGVSSCHTALLIEPYSNPYYENDRGSSVIELKVAKERIEVADRFGFSVRTHTIGDQAVKDLTDLYSCNSKNRSYYHVLEHLENVDFKDLDRMSEKRIVACVQPQHLIMDVNGVMEDLGRERMHTMWPFRTMLDRKVILAFGSDAPVVNGSVMETIASAVTRKENHYTESFIENECIEIEEALVAHTYGSACAANREDMIGLIKKGYYADLTILDKNLLLDEYRNNPDEIIETKVSYTILGGKIVYEKNLKKNTKMN